MTRLAKLLCAMLFLTSDTVRTAAEFRQPAEAWRLDLPLLGPARLHVKVATLIRVVTSRWGIRLLDGRTIRTRWGLVRAAATDGGRRLDLRCAPCLVRSPAIHRTAALSLDVGLGIARDGNRLSGRLVVNGLAVQFTASLGDEGIQGDLALDEVPVREVYGLFAPAIPELRWAQISGTVAARGRFSLPEGRLGLNPEVNGFEVRGLGTERLAWGQVGYGCASASGRAPVCRSGERTTDWLAPREMGKWLPRAVLAAEDARFFDHPGYDLVEIIAALQSDLDSRGFQRGGSTLTQQLARSLFLSSEKTLARKLREILYAVEMEQTLGKPRLLSLYLNTVEWGPGIHGARHAALAYFGKEPKSLRPEEAAWLAAILRNPWRAWHTQFVTGRPDVERVTWVIGRMKGLKRADRKRAMTRSLQFAAARPPSSPGTTMRVKRARGAMPPHPGPVRIHPQNDGAGRLQAGDSTPGARERLEPAERRFLSVGVAERDEPLHQ